MSALDDRRARAVHELTNRLDAVASRLEQILAGADEKTPTLASEALEDLAAARIVAHTLAETASGDFALSDLGILVQRADHRARLHGTRSGARVALGAAAVHAVLESVLRCERAHSPTISAVAVGRRARVTIESAAEPFAVEERDRLLDPLRLRNPEELGGGLAFSACAEIVRRAGGNFTLGGDGRRSYSIELPLAGTARPRTL